MSLEGAEQMQVAPSGGKIGWVGGGKMGGPMAIHLLAAGNTLLVTDPSETTRAEMSALGAQTDAGLEIQSGAGLVFSTLPNDDVLTAVVSGAGGSQGLVHLMAQGSTLVEMSTVSPECSAKIAKDLERAGIYYLRAPISGSTAMAKSASLTVLASGDQVAWPTVLPVLRLMSSKQFFLGTAEEARYMKLVLNTLVGASSAILAEAVALGASGGLSRAAMMEVICESAVASPLLKYKTDLVVSDDYVPAFTIDQMIKDFTLISDAGRANGIPLMAAGLILELYRAAANAGLQNEDFFALVKWQSGISAQ